MASELYLMEVGDGRYSILLCDKMAEKNDYFIMGENRRFF